MSWSKGYKNVEDFEAEVETHPSTYELDARQQGQVKIGREAARALIERLREDDPGADFSVSISGHANAEPSAGDYQSVSLTRIAPSA